MDRQSYKKIVGFIIPWLMVTVILSIGTGIKVKKEVQIYHRQRNEMIVMDSEQEEELREIFDYYISEMKTSSFHFWLFLIGVTTLSFAVGYGIQYIREKKEKGDNLKDLRMLSERLEAFQKGNYEVTPFPRDRKKTEEWMKIEASLRELGYYFTDLKEKLEREENSTKSLITDISHQLKTPLASLRMSHELAQETEMTYEERQGFLTMEEQEINRLEILVEELVHLSRLENHMIEIKPQESSLKQTLTEAINQVFMKAHSKDIKLKINLEEDIILPHDPKWTLEAMANVLDNAIKYSKEGSCVSVRVHKLLKLIMIEVEDEGIGIAAEDLHRIFQRFYRGKNASSQVKEGAGVGLYLARRILEEQGGTIVAKRKQPNGTIFRITLPMETLTKL